MATGEGGKAEQAGDSASLEALARVGMIAYGVVHLLISWLALQLAWGAAASKSADPAGPRCSGCSGWPLGRPAHPTCVVMVDLFNEGRDTAALGVLQQCDSHHRSADVATLWDAAK